MKTNAEDNRVYTMPQIDGSGDYFKAKLCQTIPDFNHTLMLVRKEFKFRFFPYGNIGNCWNWIQ